MKSFLGILLAIAGVSGATLATSVAFFPLGVGGVEPGRGAGVFNSRCAGCHAVAEGASAGFGPNLAGIGAAAATRVPGRSAPEYLLESILEPAAFHAPGSEGEMPEGTVADLPPDLVRDLVAWLAMLGSRADLKEIAMMDIPTTSPPEPRTETSWEEILRGHELFSEELGCAACHNTMDVPGAALMAPSLERASQLKPEYILESIQRPDALVPAGWRRSTLTRKDGVKLSGRVIHEDGDSVTILAYQPGGGVSPRLVEKGEIVSLETSPRSPMPAYTLSKKEKRAVLAYLGFLNGGT